MKITKRQLRKIIKEEKSRLVREMNPDGTISDDEDQLREELNKEVAERTAELIDYIHVTADRIGGGLRGPGIRRQAQEVMMAEVKRFRRRQ